jgi:hypothetical protein
MASNKRIASWSTAPDGSKLRISMQGTTKKKLVTAHLFLLRDDGFEQQVLDDQIQPGPFELKLESPHTYSIALDLIFVTTGTADVTAQVVSGKKQVPPDGSTDKQFTSTVTAPAGADPGFTFFIVTE